jgi:hypothetical protein
LQAMADEVVSVAKGFSPVRCRSRTDCYRLTRDAAQSVRLMVEYLHDPSRLDKDAVSLWIDE